MKYLKKTLLAFAFIAAILFGNMAVGQNEVYAAETTSESAAEETTGKAKGAAIAIGIAAGAGAIGMAIAIAKSNESVARQPEAASDIRTQLMLGLVFIETAIIYALIVAILIIFVM